MIMRCRYSSVMSRFGPRQPDLFATARPAAAKPTRAPLDELTELLANVRAADRLPWPDAAAVMAEERRVLGLAQIAGPRGLELAAAILQETERLLVATE
jgi:hypothetical protein